MTKEMISVAEAKEILNNLTIHRHVVNKALADTAGYVLAADVYAAADIPAFNQSSMDGYAFMFADYDSGGENPLQVVSKTAAGSSHQIILQKGEAVRVFTGAPLPLGSDTVVMQEVTEEQNGRLYIRQPAIQKGDHFRPAGSEIKRGELALQKGTVITAGAIGFLGAIGVADIPVYKMPSVALIITGDELQAPGSPLQYGQVYEASSSMLEALLTQMGITDISIYYVEDNLSAITSILQQTIQDNKDLTLLTGGVSVGEFDFVVQAAGNCGVEQLFHRIKQRPGKPLFAGIKDQRVILGLPGNPSSVLTCFYEYVWPLLRKYTGHNDRLTMIKAALAAPHHKPHQLRHYLKGIYANGRVTILKGQESYKMRSFAIANCLVDLEESSKSYLEDEMVDIHLLPQYG